MVFFAYKFSDKLAASGFDVTASLTGDSLLATFWPWVRGVFIQKTGPVRLKLAGAPVIYSNSGSALIFSPVNAIMPRMRPRGVLGMSRAKGVCGPGNAGYLSLAVLPGFATKYSRSFQSSRLCVHYGYTRCLELRDSTAGELRRRIFFSTVAKEGGERVR